MMKLESTKSKVLSAIVPLLLVLAVGGFSPTPAVCQDDPDSECEVESVTFEDGWLCLHGLECDGFTADELCFRVGSGG